MSRVAITPSIVHKYLKEVDQSPSPPIEKAFKFDEEELIMMRESPPCPESSLYGLKITKEVLKKATEKSLESPNMLEAIFCFNELSPQIESLKLLTKEESEEGYAMLSNDDLFVIKVSQKGNRQMIHEYFIGVFGLNALRHQIPNFSYILGIFACSPPIIENNKIAAYCQNRTEKTYYVIYENIKNAKSVYDFVKECTASEFIILHLQIALAISLAFHACSFTHYDLHGDNVLVRKLPKPIIIAYPFKGRHIYIKTKFIASIIDYGRSHIVYKGESFGMNNPYASVFNFAFPMRDLYQILFKSVIFILNKRLISNDLLNALREMISFFDDSAIHLYGSNFIEYLSDIIENYALLPPDEKYGYRQMDPDLYIEHLLEKFKLTKEITDQPPDQPFEIYGCHEKKPCPNTIETIASIASITGETVFTPNSDYFFMELEKSKNIIKWGSKFKENFMRELQKRRDDLYKSVKLPRDESKEEKLRYIQEMSRVKNIDDRLRSLAKIYPKLKYNFPENDYAIANNIINKLKSENPDYPLEIFK